MIIALRLGNLYHNWFTSVSNAFSEMNVDKLLVYYRIWQRDPMVYASNDVCRSTRLLFHMGLTCIYILLSGTLKLLQLVPWINVPVSTVDNTGVYVLPLFALRQTYFGKTLKYCWLLHHFQTQWERSEMQFVLIMTLDDLVTQGATICYGLSLVGIFGYKYPTRVEHGIISK